MQLETRGVEIVLLSPQWGRQSGYLTDAEAQLYMTARGQQSEEPTQGELPLRIYSRLAVSA